MPWKMDGEHIAMQDGKPIWTDKDGKDAPFDAEHALNKITELNSEAASKKRELREAQDKLKVLDGIEKPDEFMVEAKEAMKTVRNFKDKDLVEAGKVEEVKAEVTKAMQAKIDEANAATEQVKADYHKSLVGGSFARSKFIAEKLNIPVDMAQAAFEKHFSIEDGKVVAKDASGNPIFSTEKPGDLAGFDEAFAKIVDAYPQKDSILKGSSASGGGTTPGGGNGQPDGKKTIDRATFDGMGQADRAKFFAEGGKIADS